MSKFSMSNTFIRKLEGYGSLTDEEKTLLSTAWSQITTVPSRVDLVDVGKPAPVVHVILDGFACRYKMTSDSRRQIFAYLVPGDACDLHSALLNVSDHSIGTLSNCIVAQIDHETVLSLAKNASVAKAFWCSTLLDLAILREWITGIGQRLADVRIAHLFCELHARLKSVDMAKDREFSLPISQGELADTVGLSMVQVNRSLKVLREKHLVTFRGHNVSIPDMEQLREFASFDPTYLHLKNS
jgi:CRP-like cAMP-binding protein